MFSKQKEIHEFVRSLRQTAQLQAWKCVFSTVNSFSSSSPDSMDPETAQVSFCGMTDSKLKPLTDAVVHGHFIALKVVEDLFKNFQGSLWTSSRLVILSNISGQGNRQVLMGAAAPYLRSYFL